MSVLGRDRVPTKVLVVDADIMTAHLLAADLRRHDKFHVVHCATNSSNLSGFISENSPDILLAGTRSRETAFTWLPLVRQIRKQHPATRIVVLLDESARELIAELFRAGVKGVFNRAEYDLQRLCRCIACVASGQIWANSEQLEFVLDVFAEAASLNIVNANGEELLTRREKDVSRLVAEGLGNREIAQQLGLSMHTVKNYLFNIFEKLGISSRAELVMYVLSNSDNSVLRADGKERPGVLKKPAQGVRSHRDPQFPAGPRLARQLGTG